jgi:hypothetical protein
VRLIAQPTMPVRMGNPPDFRRVFLCHQENADAAISYMRFHASDNHHVRLTKYFYKQVKQ